MRLVRLQIENYRSFFKASPITFAPGVTLLFGRNNAGKSTVLRALAGFTSLKGPHNGPRNRRPSGEIADGSVSAVLDFSTTADDVDPLLSTDRDVLAFGSPARSGIVLVNAIRSDATYRAFIGAEGQATTLPSYFDDALAPASLASQTDIVAIRRNPKVQTGFDVQARSRRALGQGYLGEEIGNRLLGELSQRMFTIDAVRLPSYDVLVYPTHELGPTSTNLVAVLDSLHPQRKRFAEYEAYVKRVLPEVHEIRPVASGTDGHKKIVLAMRESGDDVEFDAEALGTGTLQVLALVHVITMSRRPRIIVLDEPSTHLHPGAVRELFRLMNEFKQHQYVVATHNTVALDVLTNPQLVVVERDPSGVSTTKSLVPSDVTDQRHLLRSIGASLGDVFGADHVIWVEGFTECEVFKRIAASTPDVPRGIAFLPIVNTGDLDTKRANVAAEIYERLSTSGGMIPSTVTFLLDAEDRSQQAQLELKSRTKQRCFFTTAGRMLENIFLDARLISTFLIELGANDATPDAVEGVWNALDDLKLFKVGKREDTTDWHRVVHAANVLAKTVEHYFGSTLGYDKVLHGIRLTEIALRDDRSLLEPLVATLAAALGLQPPA